MAEVRFVAVDPDSPAATGMVEAYTAHLVAVRPDFDLSTDAPPPGGAFVDPRGRFLVLFEDDTPIGCGAVWEMEPGIAEIRRMWIVPSHHGRGLGRRMLEALEEAAVGLGCHTARLDSMQVLEAAVAMYRSQGYVEIESYNANPNADIWLERDLQV
jgi:GNAT superfamily N-acetyltransferase